MINTIDNFSWKTRPWKKFREKVYLIQTQIFNCIKYKQFKKALLYQEFLLFSCEICYLAVKQITQLRLDRKISGIDNKLISNSSQRNELLVIIKNNLSCWSSKQLKQVYLVDFLKGNVLIYVPIVADRIVQYIWSLILEPVFNSLFFENQVSLSNINRFLFVKYTVLLRLVAQHPASHFNYIHFKFKLSSVFVNKFTRTHFLKILFFPEKYKIEFVNSFKAKTLWNANFINENLCFYLHIFHCFLLFFGIGSLKQIFWKKLYSQFGAYSNYLIFSVNYFTEIAIFFRKDINSNLYLNLITNLILENKTLSTTFVITRTNSRTGINFLDWHFIFLNEGRYIIIPGLDKWVEDKEQGKRLLRITKFNIYQRIKLIDLFVRTRFLDNWFCSVFFMKKQWYFLRFYLNKKITKCSRFLKYEKNYILTKLFNVF